MLSWMLSKYYNLRILMSTYIWAAVAAAGGLYLLHKDYHNAHQSISQQTNGFYETMNGHISALEKLKEADAAKRMEATE